MARPPIRGPRTVSLPLARDGGPGADADSEGVDAAKHTLHRRPNGMDRLLGDCETVARFTSDDAPPARSRLEGALGSGARVPPGGRARAAGTRRVLARPLVPRAAEAQHEEEDPEPGEQAEEEGVRRRRLPPGGRPEAEVKPPEERRPRLKEGARRCIGCESTAPAGRARPEPHGFVK